MSIIGASLTFLLAGALPVACSSSPHTNRSTLDLHCQRQEQNFAMGRSGGFERAPARTGLYSCAPLCCIPPYSSVSIFFFTNKYFIRKIQSVSMMLYTKNTLSSNHARPPSGPGIFSGPHVHTTYDVHRLARRALIWPGAIHCKVYRAVDIPLIRIEGPGEIMPSGDPPTSSGHDPSKHTTRWSGFDLSREFS